MTVPCKLHPYTYCDCLEKPTRYNNTGLNRVELNYFNDLIKSQYQGKLIALRRSGNIIRFKLAEYPEHWIMTYMRRS